MFDRVLGLPAHPLMVHAAVVLVPLLALAGIAYAVAPFTRRHVRWPVIFLAVAAPGAVFAAKQSGEAFSESPNFAAAEMQAKIQSHGEFGDLLFWLVLGLGAVVLALAFLIVGQVEKGPAVVRWLLMGAAVVLGAVSLFYVFKTGDSGAKMVWTGF